MARILMAMSNHPVTITVVALFWISLSVAGAGMLILSTFRNTIKMSLSLSLSLRETHVDLLQLYSCRCYVDAEEVYFYSRRDEMEVPAASRSCCLCYYYQSVSSCLLMRITCFFFSFSLFLFLASMDLQLNNKRERVQLPVTKRTFIYLRYSSSLGLSTPAALVCALIIIINFKDPTRWTRVARICALCVLFYFSQ